MSKVIIIGNGPAGISASLYTVRGGIDTTVIGGGSGSLGKAEKIENYYGFAEPISGDELVANGIAQAKRLGVNVMEDEVVGLSYNGKYVVTAKTASMETDAVILATGSSRTTPKIGGLKELEGHGVSYCAVCDAFFYRGKDVAVLGNGDYAVHEAMELKAVVKSVTILTNGLPMAAEVPEGIAVNTAVLKEFAGDGIVERALFEDGTSVDISGVFIAVGVAGSTDLARKLGAATEGSKILVDENMSTNMPGLYAAGDCVGGILQISKAVADGTKAGMAVIASLRKK